MSVITLLKEQDEALEWLNMNVPNHPVLVLAGCAGVGKTTVMDIFKHHSAYPVVTLHKSELRKPVGLVEKLGRAQIVGIHEGLPKYISESLASGWKCVIFVTNYVPNFLGDVPVYVLELQDNPFLKGGK